MFSTVHPIRTPPTNAFALTASQSQGGVSLVRTLHCCDENNDRENDSAGTLPDPEWMIGNGLRARELRRACCGIEEPPVSSNRSFESTLPGLVERLDDIHVEFLALAQRQDILNDSGLG
jgi:hypothetical protein